MSPSEDGDGSQTVKVLTQQLFQIAYFIGDESNSTILVIFLWFETPKIGTTHVNWSIR